MTDPTDPFPTSTDRPNGSDGDPHQAPEGEPVAADSAADGEPVVASTPEPEPAPAGETVVESEDTVPATAEEGEAEPVVEIPRSSGESLEWQPVYSGDQISWQPVVASEGEESWSAPDEPAGEWQGEAGEWQGYDPAGEWQGETEGETEMLDYESGAGADWGVPEADEEPPDDTGVGGLVGHERPKGPSAQNKNRRMVVLLSVLTGVVVLIAIVAFALSNGITSQTSAGPDPTLPPTSAGTATPATLPPSLFETFTDELTGLSVRYPRAWVRSGSPVADVRLTVSGEGRQLLRIRVLPIEVPATPENIENYKTVTDGIVFSDPNNKLVQQRLIQLNGRLAYYYLYTYADAPTGQQGVHAHYFIFEGKRMFTMVLQAAPVEEFQRLAGVYDQIAESFTVPEERFAPGATTTTAPATTTTSAP